MLQRCRHIARRWPSLCLALALAAFGSQAMAATLSWCLHGDADTHVASALEPCHAAAAEHDEAATAHPGHGPALDHCPPTHPQPATHVAAASDAAYGTGPDLAALPFIVAWSIRSSAAGPDGAAAAAGCRAAPAAGPAARPRLCGAIAGTSARLLI